MVILSCLQSSGHAPKKPNSEPKIPPPPPPRSLDYRRRLCISLNLANHSMHHSEKTIAKGLPNFEIRFYRFTETYEMVRGFDTFR